MDYVSIRTVHVSCVVLSITLFMLRALMQLASINWRQWRLLRILPHANDTVLLAAAIALTVMGGQYPLAQSWLTAKVIALFVYVGAGTVALREGVSTARRSSAFILALLTFIYIAGVAWTRSPTLGMQ